MSSTEDQIHRYLLLALGVAAGAALLLHAPASGERAADLDPSAASEPVEVTRPALDAAIAELAGWMERVPRDPRTPLATNLELLARGRSALGVDGSPGASLVWTQLEALTGSKQPAAQLAGLARGAAPVESSDGDPLATLAILLETGTRLDEPLPLASGPRSARHLLELALPRAGEGHASTDPWSLDLLSFAVLGGMAERRTELVRATLASLTRLDHEQRPLTELQGNGARSANVLEQLTAEFWQRRAAGASSGRALQLSAAVFRAVAVLGEPELAQRALRHLNALLFRYQLERDVYRQLLARAQEPAQRRAIHVAALEELGRLEQALYGAHLTFRRDERTGPAPRTALSMRRAASDLIDHLQALEQGSDLAAGAEPAAPVTEELLRAATHALRGLRAARVAT